MGKALTSYDEEKSKDDIICTGHSEIDRRLGGGIPVGSLTLVEGQSDAGKSVLAQQMMWGALNDGHRVILFTTENTEDTENGFIGVFRVLCPAFVADLPPPDDASA